MLKLRNFLFLSLILILKVGCVSTQQTPGKNRSLSNVTPIVHSNLKAALDFQTAQKPVEKTIATGDEQFPRFPSYSKCEKSFFRVATVSEAIDQLITQDGWKSGWVRREDELRRTGTTEGELADSRQQDSPLFDALPLNHPFDDRIIEYVRVKNRHTEFPKHSSVVGVLENPIRTLSVGYHTGYNQGISGDHMRLDEIEVGPCAKVPECRALKAVDSTKVFQDRHLTPRFPTDGEWAIDTQIPSACVVATYRIQFGKIDNKCYSDVNGNCNFAH